jgi:hypothetical protein
MGEIKPTATDLAYDLRRELFDLERTIPCHPNHLPDRLLARAAIRRALAAEAEVEQLRDALAVRNDYREDHE